MAGTAGPPQDDKSAGGDIEFHLGTEEITLRGRYEIVSIANDILVGLWFLAGSILFLYPTMATVAIWFFIIGSVEMLIRPVIRMVRRVHLQKYHASAPDAGMDF